MKIRLIRLLIVIFLNTYAQKTIAETLSISTPYLPTSIQILDSEDLVSNVILSNISSPIYLQSSNSNSPLRPIKTSRIKEKNNEIWEILYPNQIPISLNKKFNSTMIDNSIHFFKKYLKIKDDSFVPTINESNIEQSILNISEISFIDSADGLITKFKLRNSDPNFLSSLSSIPLIDYNTAEVLGSELGKGSNLPLFGNFQIKEVSPNSHYTLVRNNYFGLKTEKDIIKEVTLKKYDNSVSRLKAIRSGGISIILAPTMNELADAQSDPTLEVIVSPFAQKSFKMQIDKNNNLLSNEIYDLQHIIIRRSLKTDNNFINFFELHSVILSVV